MLGHVGALSILGVPCWCSLLVFLVGVPCWLCPKSIALLYGDLNSKKAVGIAKMSKKETQSLKYRKGIVEGC